MFLNLLSIEIGYTIKAPFEKIIRLNMKAPLRINGTRPEHEKLTCKSSNEPVWKAFRELTR